MEQFSTKIYFKLEKLKLWIFQTLELAPKTSLSDKKLLKVIIP